MKSKMMVMLAVAALMSVTAAFGDDGVDASFNPYRQGFPAFPGLAPGLQISKANVDQFVDALDPGMVNVVRNGWYEIKVGPTTQFAVNEKYVAATRKYAASVKLGPNVGDLEGYVAGRPFPQEPDLKDPRAGEKLAWNYKHGASGEDNASVNPFYWRYRDMRTGKVERTVKFSFHFLRFKHRLTEPAPEVPGNASNMLMAIYARVYDPQDIKGIQLLIQRYEDDHKLDDSYMFLPMTRRVRRLAPAQTTDAFLGSDAMIEDFKGYNAAISDMKWTYKGMRNVLLPMYNHNEMKFETDLPAESDGYKFVGLTGMAGCFPDVTWQLRKTYVLEAVPVRTDHPISKRIFYLDAQTMMIVRGLAYDRRGELWKNGTLGMSHPDAHLPANKGTGTPVDDVFSAVDMQAMHCTTGQFKTQGDATTNKPSMFQVQYMRNES
ncbi:MAG: DUF1329 domain-containing protein [Rhodocyclaceae bacterium]|nr:MAG: DUF1329 domain-containing protein [Rhodocyclaceae bacterium]